MDAMMGALIALLTLSIPFLVVANDYQARPERQVSRV